MSLNLWELQKAVRNTLVAHAPLATLVGVRIYDIAPQTVVFPYIKLGPLTTADTGVDCFEDSLDATFDLHTWSRTRGFQETHTIQAAIHAALHRQTLALPGLFKTISVTVDAQRAFIDTDGLTVHGVTSVLARIASS